MGLGKLLKPRLQKIVSKGVWREFCGINLVYQKCYAGRILLLEMFWNGFRALVAASVKGL